MVLLIFERSEETELWRPETALVIAVIGMALLTEGPELGSTGWVLSTSGGASTAGRASVGTLRVCSSASGTEGTLIGAART